MRFNFNSTVSTLRNAIFRREGMPETQNAEAPAPTNAYDLSTSNPMVNRAYQSFLEAANEYVAGESKHTYGSLRRLHDAGRKFETAFTAAVRQDPATTSGNLEANLADATAQLPVQPGRNRAVLMPLLGQVQVQAARYTFIPAITAESLRKFPELHAAVTAYLEALGAQSLHATKGLAGWTPALRPKIRTHEDIHEQVQISLQPNLARNDRSQAQSYIPPPRDNGSELPDYFIHNRPHDLSPDLSMRIERSLRKLGKPIGTAALSDPAAATLIDELKHLLCSGDITTVARGEILYRLAKNVPSQLQMGGTEKAKMARLFLRFLAPDRLPAKYRQAPAAIRAGVGTDGFNPETLVPYAALESITLALIEKMQHFGRHGGIVCDVLSATFERSRKIDPRTHVRFLRQALIAINRNQASLFTNRILLRDLVSVTVDEIAWCEAQVAASPREFADLSDDMVEQLTFDEQQITYALGGLSVSRAPGWNGDLNQLPAFNQLLASLRSRQRDEPFVPVSSTPAPLDLNRTDGPSGI